ncbi:unnamed protein product [Phytomonas sp. Hart1]|nr:unnamed protein product [Phytomonas sp. Hart1]|eukprot:CCW71912.1 unnamed protein product [Phytomonas sp. isolate Hart1]
MPPKRAALVKSLREAFPEDRSFAEVERWGSSTIDEFNGLLRELLPAREAIFRETYSVPSSAEATPEKLLNLLHRYEALSLKVWVAAEEIRNMIELRIPEFKEEDNLGVAVQAAVLSKLDKFQNAISGDDGEKEAVKSAAGIFSSKKYLASRASIEEKLLPKPKKASDEEKNNAKGKDKNAEDASATEDVKAPSAILELKQLDYDMLVKLELGIRHLQTRLRGFVNTYVLNSKKLIQPRTNTDGMVA